MQKFEFITRMEMRAGKDGRCDDYTQVMILNILSMLPDGVDADTIRDIVTGIAHESYRAGFVQGCHAGAMDVRNYMTAQQDWEKPLSDAEVELATHLLYDKMRDYEKRDKTISRI